MSNFQDRLEKCVDAAKRQLATFRTGRASPDLLSRIQVDYYGSPVPLQQLASISVPEPMTLHLKIFDKSGVESVEKAILSSDLNLNPQVDGNTIILRLPPLTEDRRKELVKMVRKQAEDSKISIRNIRREEMDRTKAAQKENEMTEDEAKKSQNDIQKTTDRYINKIEDLAKTKEDEILHI